VVGSRGEGTKETSKQRLRGDKKGRLRCSHLVKYRVAVGPKEKRSGESTGSRSNQNLCPGYCFLCVQRLWMGKIKQQPEIYRAGSKTNIFGPIRPIRRAQGRVAGGQQACYVIQGGAMVGDAHREGEAGSGSGIS